MKKDGSVKELVNDRRELISFERDGIRVIVTLAKFSFHLNTKELHSAIYHARLTGEGSTVTGVVENDSDQFVNATVHVSASRGYIRIGFGVDSTGDVLIWWPRKEGRAVLQSVLAS